MVMTCISETTGCRWLKRRWRGAPDPYGIFSPGRIPTAISARTGDRGGDHCAAVPRGRYAAVLLWRLVPRIVFPLRPGAGPVFLLVPGRAPVERRIAIRPSGPLRHLHVPSRRLEPCGRQQHLASAV